MSKKYTASENISEWVPIRTDKIKDDCEYITRSKCLFGCIHINYIKLWKNDKFIESCIDCQLYKQKEIQNVKTKRIKKQKDISKGTTETVNS